MDELTFHHELHQLKQQIADMAMKHGQALSPTLQQSAPPCDEFPEQLRDLKANIAGLDRTLASMYHGQSNATCASTHQYIQSRSSPNIYGPPTPLPLQNPPEKPSDPLLWQSLSALRADVQGFDHRAVRMEQCISRLEDKLQKLDVCRFTPTSSVSSYDGAPSPRYSQFGTESGNVVTFGGSNDRLTSMHNLTSPLAPKTACHDYARVPSVSSLLAPSDHQLQNTDEESDRYAASMLRSKAELAGATITMLHRYNESLEGNNTQLDKENAKLARALVELNAKLHGVEDKQSMGIDLELMAAFQQASMQRAQEDRPSYGHHLGSETTPTIHGVTSAELDAGLPHGPIQLPSQVTVEGAAFRDQEITRLDELLRTAQEDLAASEQRVLAQIHALQKVRYEYNHREVALHTEQMLSVEKEQNLQHLNNILQAKDEEIERLCDDRSQCGQDFVRSQHDLAASATRIGELEGTLRNSQAERQESDQALRERSVELRELQEFCNEKDSIARKQEEVIARGARLLEERDDDIEGLGSRLRAMESENQNQVRLAHASKLREERKDADMAKMKVGIARACAMPQRSARQWNHDLKSPDGQLALVKARLDACARIAGVPAPQDFDLVECVAPDGSLQAVAVSRNEPTRSVKFLDEPGPSWSQGSNAPSWSPQPIRGDRPLPNEARRASVWNSEKGSFPGPEFGKPSPIGHRRAAPSMDAGHWRTNVDEFAYFPVPSIRGATLQPKPSHQATAAHPVVYTSDCTTQTDAAPHRGSKHGRRGLSPERTFMPPLPAPVPAQRMQSTADMRPVRKHQSMQDLPRRTLQAYVETEESGGEFAREV
ncbi:hypothetical protein LTR08_005609 [Meristemomyces frigidus]|nr:hypothetical protein LTR08_005609 [Meristemomyces frigidus]